MTIVVGLASEGGIVLASDSQMSVGATKRAEQKVWVSNVGRGFAFGLAGAEMTMHLLRDALLAHIFPGDPMLDKASLTTCVYNVLAPEYTRCTSLGVAAADLPNVAGASGIIANYDNSGAPHVYLFDYLGRVIDHARGLAITGAGAPLGEQVAAVFREVRSQPLTLHQAKMFAYRIVSDAIEIGGPGVGIGGAIQLATVTPDAVTLLDRDEPATVDAVTNWMQAEAARFVEHQPPGAVVA